MEKIKKKSPRTIRGTATIHDDDRIEFNPYAQGESTQTNVKTCTGGGKRWTTTGADPSKMICLKCKESSPDQYADVLAQFNALTKDMKPQQPLQQPDHLRVVAEDGLQCWLNESKAELTFTGSINLTKHSRDWQAEVLRQVQLIVRRLPANERFNRVINKIRKESCLK